MGAFKNVGYSGDNNTSDPKNKKKVDKAKEELDIVLLKLSISNAQVKKIEDKTKEIEKLDKQIKEKQIEFTDISFEIHQAKEAINYVEQNESEKLKEIKSAVSKKQKELVSLYEEAEDLAEVKTIQERKISEQVKEMEKNARELIQKRDEGNSIIEAKRNEIKTLDNKISEIREEAKKYSNIAGDIVVSESKLSGLNGLLSEASLEYLNSKKKLDKVRKELETDEKTLTSVREKVAEEIAKAEIVREEFNNEYNEKDGNISRRERSLVVKEDALRRIKEKLEIIDPQSVSGIKI